MIDTQELQSRKALVFYANIYRESSVPGVVSKRISLLHWLNGPLVGGASLWEAKQMTNSDGLGQKPKFSGEALFMTSLASFLESAGQWVHENREYLRLLLVGFGGSIADMREYPQFDFPLVRKEDINTVMQNGWCPPLDISPVQVELLAKAFEEDAERANRLLSDRYRSKLDGIESSRMSAFPNRAEILGDTFEAHRQEKYNLSVPLLLMQADGVWWDRLSRNVFIGGFTNAVDDLVGKVPDSTIREIVRALSYKQLPLVMTSKCRDIGFSELNRHQIIHGEVTDYGTEENSLKAVSFLNFCAFVLSGLFDEP